jgi:hypothetical protein
MRVQSVQELESEVKVGLEEEDSDGFEAEIDEHSIGLQFSVTFVC